jgi:hypothetical protein
VHGAGSHRYTVTYRSLKAMPQTLRPMSDRLALGIAWHLPSSEKVIRV